MLLLIEQNGRAVGACDGADLEQTLERLRVPGQPAWFDVWDAAGDRLEEPHDILVAHGTTTRYVYHGCRCDPCRAAHRAANIRQKAARTAALRADPTLAPHGRVATRLGWACECLPCVEAGRTYGRAKYHGDRAGVRWALAHTFDGRSLRPVEVGRDVSMFEEAT